MGRVFAKGVELDFCQFCGGVWFDPGEVLEVTGRSEQLESVQRPDLSCPDCATPLTRGEISGCAVERCDACNGTYAPPDTLERLAGGKVPLLAIPERSASQPLEFRCGGCGERFPWDRAVTTGRGLACVNCASSMGSSSNILPSVAMDLAQAAAIANLDLDTFGAAFDSGTGVEDALIENPFVLTLVRFFTFFAS